MEQNLRTFFILYHNLMNNLCRKKISFLVFDKTKLELNQNWPKSTKIKQNEPKNLAKYLVEFFVNLCLCVKCTS